MSDLTRRDFLVTAATACACALCPLSAALGAGDFAPVDIGAAADIGQGISDQFVKSGRCFIVRQGDRIYAPSAVCTHKRATLSVSGDGFKCAKHGSAFSSAGEVTKGPAKSSLPRLAIRLDEQNHVIVNPSKQFEPDQWTNGESFVDVKQQP